MRAPLRRQVNLVGSQWLRNGTEKIVTGEGTSGGVVQAKSKETVETDKLAPGSAGRMDYEVLQKGDMMYHNQEPGVKSGNSNSDNQAEGGKMNTGAKSVILESKKRITDSGDGPIMGLHTEIEQESDNEDTMCMEKYCVKKRIWDGFRGSGPPGIMSILS
ncbi:hypothetical protein AgCh_001727 [Apium graveolens]